MWKDKRIPLSSDLTFSVASLAARRWSCEGGLELLFLLPLICSFTSVAGLSFATPAFGISSTGTVSEVSFAWLSEELASPTDSLSDSSISSGGGPALQISTNFATRTFANGRLQVADIIGGQPASILPLWVKEACRRWALLVSSMSSVWPCNMDSLLGLYS